MTTFKISVVIPVKDGAATLDKCLNSLRKQTIGNDLEIIIADSMSTDGSREIGCRYGATILDIPNGTFDHGLTRNKGVQATSGELIYLTVQDAWIGENDMLERMARHFDDATVMAVVGHQAVPHEKDKNPFIWYRPISASSVTERIVVSSEDFKNMPISEQQSLVAWDDVVAMYRRTGLIEQPFVQTSFAEDWIWSYHALLKGWKLLHDSALVVYHYHHHSFQYSFKTNYTINYHFYKFFKYIPTYPALIMPVIRSTYHLIKHKQLSLREKIYWSEHNIFSRLAYFISTLNFLIRLKFGGKASIEKGYTRYCKFIPQGKQK